MKKLLYLGFCLLLYIPSYTVLAFDTYVIHPSVARQVADYYNNQSAQPLTSQEIEWLVQGSLEEDEPIIRAFNHFYNPITQEGLRIGGISLGLPSPVWAHAGWRQQLHPGGDCTWQAAVAAYANQDEARGFRCLGHILHLLEDAAVPAHTRNDQHATGDLFEEWAKYHDPPVSQVSPVILPQCHTDQACIIELATWVNRNFLSEDTINGDSFALPFSEARVEEGYLVYEDHRIAVYNPRRHSFVLTQEIQAEYWRLISPVLLEYGYQLLTIFFKETHQTPPPSSPEPALPSVYSPLPNNTTPLPGSPSSTITPSAVSDGKIPSQSVKTSPIITSDPVSSVPESVSSSIPSVKEPPVPDVPSYIPVSGEGRRPDTYLTTRPASKTKDTTADFMFTSDSSSSIFECRYDEGEWIACSSPYRLTDLEEGKHSFEVRAVTHLGPDTTPLRYEWAIDITPPVSFLLPDVSSQNREAHFIFGSEADAHFECRLDQEEWHECISPIDYINLASGEHRFWIRAIDQVGNTEPLPLAYTWMIEIAPPVPPILLFPSTSPYHTNQASVIFRGRAATDTEILVNDSTVEVERSGEEWAWESQVENGEQNFVFRTRNYYQEKSEPVEIRVVGDTTPPSAAIQNLAEVYQTKDFLITWQGLDNTSSSLKFQVDYQVNQEGWKVWQSNSPETEHIFRDAPVHQALGFRVRAQDEAGNIGEWSPVVTTRFSPSQGEHLVISQLVTQGSRGSKAEFIELHNPTGRTVYLAGISLQKKASSGFLWETVISSSTVEHAVIPPHGYFLVAGKDYDYQTLPDLRLEEELAYDESGHIRILNSEGEELDRIGYGSAYEPEGLAMISPPLGSSLQRKAHYSSTATSIYTHPEEGNGYDSDFNFFDFVLQDNVTPHASQYQAGPIDLQIDLAALWHFDECVTETANSITSQWFTLPVLSIVGRYGCAFSQEWYPDQDILWYFNEPIPAFEATLSFYVREPQFGSRGSIFLVDSINHLALGASATKIQDRIFYNDNQIDLPSALPDDTAWHLITVVYSHNYVAWYRDGELKVKLSGDYSLDRPLFGIFVGQDNYPWEMDEIALWQRALSSGEVAALLNEQLAPHLIRPVQPSADLVHFWNFDEGVPTAHDSIGNRDLEYYDTVAGRSGQALAMYWYRRPQINSAIDSITSKDVSISYWRKRSDIGNGGGAVGLLSSQYGSLFGSGGGYNQSYYFFNGKSDVLAAHLPDDDLWHHIALVYDSYDYELRYYIDGVSYPPVSLVWPLLPHDRLFIKEDQYGFFVDDLKIWQGTLTNAEVMEEFHNP